MIKIDIIYKDKGLKKLSVKGHADYAESGKDIVCAGVSACLIGALNALENADDYKISIDEGDALIKGDGSISEHDSIVFETLIMQLKTIQTSYKGFIEIKERKEKI